MNYVEQQMRWCSFITSCQLLIVRQVSQHYNSFANFIGFYPCDAMLARVIAIASCPSVCLSRDGIVSKRRKLAA